MENRIPHNRCQLEGRRYGDLTVLGPTGEKKNDSRLWLCRCDCGNEISVTARDLNRGAFKSCGCRRHRPPEESHTIKKNLHFVDGTCVENLIASQRRPVTNQTGVRGVYYQKRSGSYVAYIRFQNQAHYLGRFDTLAEAATVRKKAEHQYFDTFLENYFDAEGKTPWTAAVQEEPVAKKAPRRPSGYRADTTHVI